MKSCVFCKKEEDGLLCRHCLAKSTSSVGTFVKGAGKYLLGAVVLIGTSYINNKFRKNKL